MTITLAALMLWAAPVRAGRAEIPVTIAPPLLRAFFMEELFNGPGGAAEVVDEADGCRRITLTAPELSTEGARVALWARVTMRAGVTLFNQCVTPVTWEGLIQVMQRPSLQEGEWKLRFISEESRLYNERRQPAMLSGLLYRFARKHVHAALDAVTVNLAPPVDDLKSLLDDFIPAERRALAARLAESLRPGAASVSPDGVRVTILAEVPEGAAPVSGERPLSGEELARFEEGWERFDAYLANLVTALADRPLDGEDHAILLDTLLTMRYRFMDELARGAARDDFVREQFMESWQGMAPVFRKRLADGEGRSTLAYLSFFTAGDALVALKRIGPALGIDISRDGLLRMARLAAGEGATLAYTGRADGGLRRALGLGPPLEESEIPPEMQDESALRLAVHIMRVRELLAAAGGRAASNGINGERAREFFLAVLAPLAWQESCFKQFKMIKGKAGYIRSYNNTSVGLMQVNERVWRGVYNPENLRWNIQYNARAGAEIASLYLTRYALSTAGEAALDDPGALAGLLYALYNGGPGERAKFPDRKTRGKLYLSDQLFAEKWRWAAGGEWGEARQCF
ncbi:MAG: hypothetical protein HY804_04455 [Nitrospinae bacterium]|nr:hypothetical protein [Nitrospinota bacterium]